MAAYASSLPMLRIGGRVVCVGIPEGAMVGIASAYPGLFIAKELSVIGSAVGTRMEAIETLDFAARGIVKMHIQTEKLENLSKVCILYIRFDTIY